MLLLIEPTRHVAFSLSRQSTTNLLSAKDTAAYGAFSFWRRYIVGARMADKMVLVVGAGLAGAVYARQLAEAGLRVQVIDARSHIAGNAYDEVTSDGIRIHRYGPHLFHTANTRVLDYVRRYANWVPYTHRVRALLPSGRLAPLPINIDTINAVCGLNLETEDQARAYLSSISAPISEPANAAEYLASKVGVELRDLFFRPYTKKMWEMDLENMDVAVVKRLPIRYNRSDTYFPDDQTQILPKNGYTEFVGEILNHNNINVLLNTKFDRKMMGGFYHCFASLPIDEYYQFCEGELPYRSIKFHHRRESYLQAENSIWGSVENAKFSVINYTDDSPYTRETAWHLLPNHVIGRSGHVIFTREEPCDYRENNYERYYPVRSVDGVNAATYERYRALAERDRDRITFIGRCGTYRYLDMDQVINQSLMGVNQWLGGR